MASGYSRLHDEDRRGGRRSYGSIDSPNVDFAPVQQTNNTEYFQLCDKITSHLFTINNAATTLERTLKQLGSPSDCQQLRDHISQINSSAGTAVNETTSLLRSLQPHTHGHKQRRIQADRLQTEFQSAASRFAEFQKKMVVVVRKARLPSDMVAVEQDSATTDAMIEAEQQRQERLKEVQDLEFESAMLVEREQRVSQLEADIIDINGIMRDLSSMVVEQGQVINTIEDNVEQTAGHVEEGREELVKAARLQNKSRRKLCFCILLLIIVLAIIAIILALHFTNH